MPSLPHAAGARSREVETHRKSTPRVRRDASLDALRALAVLVMVVWHVADGWLASALREGAGWHAVRVAGGLAAPCFLFVSGVAVARSQQAGRSVGRIMYRGVEVMALGGLLRLQNWLVDAGGMMEWRSLAPALLGVSGYASLLVLAHRQERRLWTVAGLLLAAFAWRVGADVPDHAARILAVDVLSCIGASVVLTAALSRLSAPLLVAAGAAVVCATPWLPHVFDNAWLAGWVGTPHAESARYALFPLCPWVGYAWIGCGLGEAQRTRPIAMGVMGVALAALCFEGGVPGTRRLLHDLPSLRPFARFAFQLGAVLALGGLGAHLRGCTPLTALGRVSLPVYWVHLQIAYGLLSLPFARASPPWLCALGATTILVVATGAATCSKGVRFLPTSLNRARASGANPRA